MSLALLQVYSSAEEEDDDRQYENSSDDTDHEGERNGSVPRMPSSYNPLPSSLKPSAGSALPSAFEVFSEISGPPQFLNHSVEESNSGREGVVNRGRRRNRDKKDFPTGAVVEARAQLVGIHERVRSDIEGIVPSTSTRTPKGSTGTAAEGGKRANPNAEDAPQLLRICEQCGIPKTASSASGMICPVCSGRPPLEDQGKKKGSTVKDKEKIKRMRGQSSHASWKSETEMHLRQQFD